MLCQYVLCHCMFVYFSVHVVFVWPAVCGCCMWRSDVACQSEAMLHVSLDTLHLGMGVQVACVPFPSPSASFWVVCCTLPECLTLGVCCWGFCVCGCSLEVSACIHSYCSLNYTREWHCVPGYIVCRGESVCVVNHSTSIYVQVAMCMMCVRVHLSVCWVIGDYHGCVPKDGVSARVRCVMFGTL